MYIGEVVGKVVSTVKEEGLENVPLLVVHLIEKGKKTKMIVAAEKSHHNSLKTAHAASKMLARFCLYCSALPLLKVS